MARVIRSFRFKMLLLFGLSMVFAGAITFSIYKAAQFYYYTTKFEDPLTRVRYFMREVGDVNFFLIIFVPLSVWFFFLLTKRYAGYFRIISDGINQLANGDFNSRIHISAKDEFGDIARDINLAGIKLREALERGDFAENSKEQLVLNLAHDLRTPLTSVIGYLDLILNDGNLTTGQILQYNKVAYSKSRRLETLIDELFEVAKLSGGKMVIQSQPIDLSELLLQLNEELYPVFERNGLTARLNIVPSLTIKGDGELLARVFGNLLSNAAHYGREGKVIDIHGYSDGDMNVVSIVNYGDPIPAKELPHIFDMYYTGDKARTYNNKSTGLGLFIARNIVERHKGTLTAESSPICTRFEVRLPAHRLDSAE